MVTTLIESHPGAVGAVLVDRMGYVYLADFRESVWQLNPVNLEMRRYVDGLYGASGSAFDKNGNLYQASFFGHYISRISRSGEVEVVADEGLAGPVGLAFDDEGGLLVCSCNDGAVKRVDAEGQVTSFATSDHFNCPNGITKDDEGNFYVVSFSGSKVIRITPDQDVSVFADSEGKGLGHITYVRGVFYATSYWDNKVYRITSSGDVTVLAGTGERGQSDGKGATALFSNPNGIFADPTGTYLYINDYIGDPKSSGLAKTPFSVRRIELPSLTRTLDHYLTHGSIEDMREAYQEFTSNPALAGEHTESGLNALGWTYLGEDKHAEAVALFELNAAAHPESWRVFSSLGAGYMRLGESKKAIEVLQRSLELNPDNGLAKARLVTLGVVEE